MWLVVLLILAAGYYLSLKIWPLAPCGRCRGNGKNRGSTRRRFGRCGKCGGSGKKLRLGVRLFMRR